MRKIAPPCRQVRGSAACPRRERRAGRLCSGAWRRGEEARKTAEGAIGRKVGVFGRQPGIFAFGPGRWERSPRRAARHGGPRRERRAGRRCCGVGRRGPLGWVLGGVGSARKGDDPYGFLPVSGRCGNPNAAKCLPNGARVIIIAGLNGAWLRPVERTVRVREVRGSNPRAPTKQFHTAHTRGRFCF